MKQFLMTALLAGSLAAFTGCKDDDGGKSQNYPSQIPAAEKIPVVAWHGVRATHASVERVREAEQMGITLNYSRMGNVETALKCLDYAAETGIKLIVECDELYTESKRIDAVNRLKGHPALAGYFVMDEPHPTQFANMSKMMSDIQHVDRKHICYANIFPTGGPEHYATLGVKDYNEYIDRYMAEVPEITVLSFDKYPIIKDPNVADSPRQILGEWYQCLEIVRDRALRSGMDFWSFMLTVPHTSYPQPTVDDLRLQAYSNLAYGTQVLQCFTYWTPTVENPELWKYRNGPIAEDGTRTETYDIVKSVPGQQSNGRLPHRHPAAAGHPRPGQAPCRDHRTVGGPRNQHGVHFVLREPRLPFHDGGQHRHQRKVLPQCRHAGARAPHSQGRLRAAGLERPAHADARPGRHGALHVVAARSAGQNPEKTAPRTAFSGFSRIFVPQGFGAGIARTPPDEKGIR